MIKPSNAPLYLALGAGLLFGAFQLFPDEPLRLPSVVSVPVRNTATGEGPGRGMLRRGAAVPPSADYFSPAAEQSARAERQTTGTSAPVILQRPEYSAILAEHALNERQLAVLRHFDGNGGAQGQMLYAFLRENGKLELFPATGTELTGEAAVAERGLPPSQATQEEGSPMPADPYQALRETEPESEAAHAEEGHSSEAYFSQVIPSQPTT